MRFLQYIFSLLFDCVRHVFSQQIRMQATDEYNIR